MERSVSHSTQETSQRKETVHEASWAEEPQIANGPVLEPKERRCSCVPLQESRDEMIGGIKKYLLEERKARSRGDSETMGEGKKPTAAGEDGQRRRNASELKREQGWPPFKGASFAGATGERTFLFKRRRCMLSEV